MPSQAIWEVLIVGLSAFLLGSIPFGLIISKLFYNTDLRNFGSGNIGTTNAMRILGNKVGLVVFMLDAGKGLLAGLVALWVSYGASGLLSMCSCSLTQADLLAFATLSVTIGHIYSFWLKGKGGKGVACAIGAFFVCFGPGVALGQILVFLLIVKFGNYVSLGSVVSAALVPVIAFALFWGDWLAVLMCSLAGIVIIWAHRSNIKRLLNQEELPYKKHA